ncbi:MAG: FHA domain-containing protein [Myxococcota bacterium]
MVELIVTRAGHPDRRFRLGNGAYTIGRHDSNAITLPDPEVSRLHARLLIDGSTAVMVDNQSGNGTYVRDEPVEEVLLTPGLSVEILPFTLRLAGGARARARLVGVKGAFAGQHHFLDNDRTTLGRSEDQDLPLADPGASRAHGVVERRGDHWFLVDNQSANGLFVNEERVTEHRLTHGDEVRVGQTRMRFVVDQPPSDTQPIPLAQPAPAASTGGGGNLWSVGLVVGVVVAMLAVAAWSQAS